LHWEDWALVAGAPVSFENDALMIVDLTKTSNP
jgi:hypothetical protein